jgi:hypothetical protein
VCLVLAAVVDVVIVVVFGDVFMQKYSKASHEEENCLQS